MTHQLTGVGVAAVTAAALDTPGTTAAMLLSASWLGSMLPDADLAGARLYRRTRIERRVLLARTVGSLARLPLRLLVLLPHRGVTHSLAACALAAALFASLVALADPTRRDHNRDRRRDRLRRSHRRRRLHPVRVPKWAPISTRRRRLLPARARIPTGSLREYTIAALLATLLWGAAALFTG